MSKEGFDIIKTMDTKQVSKKTLSFCSFIKLNTMKKSNNNTIDKVIFWTIIGIFVPMILGGIFTIIKNIDLVSFNF